MSTWSKFIALRKASASWAISTTELGVVPVVIPTPTLSKATTRREDASSVDQRRIPVVEVPTEMLEKDDGNGARPRSLYRRSRCHSRR